MSKKQAYEQKFQAQFDEWSAEIDKLKARAERADADAQITYHEEVDKLRARQDEMNQKLKELKDTGDDAWGDIVAGVESAQSALGNALRSARSRFN
ncbi:MAG: coiled coil domain-containing protein [Rhodospirillales bacterium]